MGALAERRRIRHGFWLRRAQQPPKQHQLFTLVHFLIHCEHSSASECGGRPPRAPPPPIVRGHQIVTKPSNVVRPFPPACLCPPSKSLAFCCARVYIRMPNANYPAAEAKLLPLGRLCNRRDAAVAPLAERRNPIFILSLAIAQKNFAEPVPLTEY
jgi:hypothetical protein